MNTPTSEYSQFTTEEIIRALELMISKEDLKIREIAESLLAAFSYSASDISEQLANGQHLSNATPLEVC